MGKMTKSDTETTTLGHSTPNPEFRGLWVTHVISMGPIASPFMYSFNKNLLVTGNFV